MEPVIVVIGNLDEYLPDGSKIGIVGVIEIGIGADANFNQHLMLYRSIW